MFRLLLKKIFLVVFHNTEAAMNLMYGNVWINAVHFYYIVLLYILYFSILYI